jgi:hypothetical protein
MLVLAGMGALTVLMFGRSLVDVVRSLRSPGLRLSIHGLDYNCFRFGWADIDFGLFDTGNTGLAVILRQWLRRYGTP